MSGLSSVKIHLRHVNGTQEKLETRLKIFLRNKIKFRERTQVFRVIDGPRCMSLLNK